MDIQILKQEISKTLDGFFSDPEFQSYFLVDVQLNNKKLLVFIDGDESVSFTICRKTSRHIEALLDEKKWLGEKYVLEVSSPGTEKALKNPRQFKKHMGRKATIALKDETTVEAKLLEMDDTKLRIEIDKEESEIQLEDIMEMKIIVSF